MKVAGFRGSIFEERLLGSKTEGMSLGRNSLKESVSNDEMPSEAESDNISEPDDVDEISAENLDPADRDLYEKLKRQEKEERAEIEKELRAHEEALARHHEEWRAKELRLQCERLGLQQREHELRAKHEEFRNHRDLIRPDPSPRTLDLSGHSPFERYIPRNVPSPTLSLSTPVGLSHTDGPPHHWTFEEQFKQLYELSEEPKRKEFLDDLFAFMQKRGTPVNRIPIMAKQTLDLYELFKLVVSKGGLVEVINKKLWREITKGLNLPSSITSAAFTLRTQYMKYLYPYECEKLKLSSPQELQSAIDGNRREGRRPSYGYELSPGPTLVPTNLTHPHLNGSLMNGKIVPPNSSGEEDSSPPTPNHHRSLTERDALAMEAASRAMEEATRKMEAASRAALEVESPPRKRLMTDEERLLVHAGMPSAHLKITSRNDGSGSIDSSLVVSMEINGVMYQGVLFAQHPRRI